MVNKIEDWDSNNRDANICNVLASMYHTEQMQQHYNMPHAL